jgi:ribosome maturation factor RimP
MKGTETFPSLIFDMEITTQISSIRTLLDAILEESPEYFVVEVKIKPTHNIKIYLDGDQGITIEKCIAINRALYKKIEELAMYPEGEFSLEVSSPGLDEPLKMHRQYVKNVQRPVEVLLLDGVKIEGKMTEVTEDGIIVEETRGKNKKKEVINHSILFNNIKSTKLQVVF